MHAILLSDDETLSIRVRDALLREGHECEPSDVVGLDQANTVLGTANPQLVVLVLPPDTERAFAVLRGLRAASSCPVIAVGPTKEPKIILQAFREGADQYLDDAEIENELTTVLACLRTTSESLSEPGTVICVMTSSGGTGASTVAVNLAAHLAKEHKSCALLDLEIEADDLTALLDLKPTHTVTDLCMNAERMDRVMFERSLTRHASGVALLASPSDLGQISGVTAQGIRQCVTWARALFPYVVVDLGRNHRSELEEALQFASTVLVVMRLEFTSLRNTQRALRRLENLGISRERVCLVANRYGSPRELPASEAEQSLGIKIASYLPDDAKTINQSNNKGVPAVLEFPKAKVSRGFMELAKVALKNGNGNGNVNGNGHTNGNGHANGHTNGYTNGNGKH